MLDVECSMFGVPASAGSHGSTGASPVPFGAPAESIFQFKVRCLPSIVPPKERRRVECGFRRTDSEGRALRNPNFNHETHKRHERSGRPVPKVAQAPRRSLSATPPKASSNSMFSVLACRGGAQRRRVLDLASGVWGPGNAPRVIAELNAADSEGRVTRDPILTTDPSVVRFRLKNINGEHD